MSTKDTFQSQLNLSMGNDSIQASMHEFDCKVTPGMGEPLASRMRPSTFEDFFGQDHIFTQCPSLKNGKIPGLVLWGPPGSGKTTLAHILARSCGKELYQFSAVLGGVAELKKLIERTREMKVLHKQEAIILIDEIHRFNKAQQDALLPFVEAGAFTLIGATTENPRVSINRALLSRLQVIELKKLASDSVRKILNRAVQENEILIEETLVTFIANRSNGDARRALSTLEVAVHSFEKDLRKISPEQIKPLMVENVRDYDKGDDRHYDVISAFIKSLRGSDPNAAMLWLAVMLEGGEDPVFIARRLVIFASEDVGNADPWALLIATSALTAIQNVGMPEARISLGQAVSYLASTVKSNASYKAVDEAIEYVRNLQTIEVPEHLKNYPREEDLEAPYKYPHDYPGHHVKQAYTKTKIPNFYRPGDLGREKQLKERLESLSNNQ